MLYTWKKHTHTLEMNMDVTDQALLVQLRQMLLKDEGYELRAYKDTEGYWTVGIGHKLTNDELSNGNPIKLTYTSEEVERLFVKDAARIIHNADATYLLWMPHLELPRKLAILNLMYNIGEHGFSKFAKLISAMSNKKYENAAKELLNSKYARQLPGRAKRLASILETGRL